MRFLIARFDVFRFLFSCPHFHANICTAVCSSNTEYAIASLLQPDMFQPKYFLTNTGYTRLEGHLHLPENELLKQTPNTIGSFPCFSGYLAFRDDCIWLVALCCLFSLACRYRVLAYCSGWNRRKGHCTLGIAKRG